MRIDLPYCGFKNCRYCFDGNCTKPSEQEKCEYWYLLHEESESTGPDLQPTCNTLATDTISRQDAIDTVEFGITYAKAIDVNTGESKELFKEGNDALKKAVERLKELPSAERTGILQRCQPVGIWIMRWKCSECGEAYEKPVNYCNYCGFKLIRQR